MSRIVIERPGKKEYLEEIDKLIMDMLVSICEKEANRFHFAMHEVVINAIQAGERRQIDKDIVVGIEFEDNCITGWVKDYFGGIDNEALNKKGTLFSESGRGLLLVEHLVDDFYFETREDKGFVVSIMKKC